MAREVRIRIVSIDVNDRISLEENERISRVEWNGRTRCRVFIVQDPAQPAPTFTTQQDGASDQSRPPKPSAPVFSPTRWSLQN
jgi:hypothetical protein